MNKDRLNSNCKAQYEKPKIEIVKQIFANSRTTTYDATSHKK